MNFIRERLIIYGLLGAICSLLTSAAYGQSSRQLEGKILEAFGGGIPGITVTLYSDDRVRTTMVDGDGDFVFTGLTAPARYLEASSKGFRSSSIPITDNTAQPVSVTLDVGSCSGGCLLVHDVRDHSVHYEERSGSEQLTGSVSEFSGPLLRNISVNLKRAAADLDAPQTSSPDWQRGPSMNQRRFRFVDVARMITNEKGEFQFTGLKPGWYSLTVGDVSYYDETVKFWIARETLTRPSRIEMAGIGPGHASPFAR
jgi:hypothetical protein